MTTPRIAISEDQIEAFCQRHRVRKLWLFGSVLRDDFGPDSDVDVLVELDDGEVMTHHKAMAMEDDLRALFGREVDLFRRQVIEQSPNYIRRKAILSTAQLVYDKG